MVEQSKTFFPYLSIVYLNSFPVENVSVTSHMTEAEQKLTKLLKDLLEDFQ